MTHRSEFRESFREARWTFWRVALWLLLPIAVFGVIGYGCSWFGEAAQVAREEFGPRGGLAKYEWFRERHEGIVSTRSKMRAAAADLKAFTEASGPRPDWSESERAEFWRLSMVHSGIHNVLLELVAEYNANSKKFNHEQFRAADLPYQEEE